MADSAGSRWPSAAREDVLRALADARALDHKFGSGRILGSMCTTPHPIGVEAYRMFLETNLGDPALFPGAKELEDHALGLIARLVAAPDAARGVFVSGGSEANFTGLRIALSEARRRAETQSSERREVIVPATAHFSFDKSIDYLGLTKRVAPVGSDWRVDVDAVNERVGPYTLAIVALAGSTEFGVVDDVPALAEIARDAGVPLHVDACFGGFVIPFARALGRSLPAFDFSVPGVETLTIDPHKMGLAPIPNGVCFARESAAVDAISTPSPYVSVDRQPTLQGTRPGAGPAATWAVMAHLGFDGYREVVRACLDVTAHLARELRAAGVSLAREPELNIVAFHVRDPKLVRRLLAERGFLVSYAPLSKGLKVVCMPHVTRAAVDAFVPALVDAIAKADG
ncbi:MAG: tyrosine decarboxylase MfnA [Thermoplasmatota archaeon]